MESERDRPGGEPAEAGEVDRDETEAFGRDPEADAQSEMPPGTNTALPPKVESWRKRSAVGAILTGFALGLQEALEKRKDEPSIVMETSGDPPRDLPVEAEFEYARPRQSVVQIRPWLLPDSTGPAAAEATPSEKDAPAGDHAPSRADAPSRDVAPSRDDAPQPGDAPPRTDGAAPAGGAEPAAGHTDRDRS